MQYFTGNQKGFAAGFTESTHKGGLLYSSLGTVLDDHGNKVNEDINQNSLRSTSITISDSVILLFEDIILRYEGNKPIKSVYLSVLRRNGNEISVANTENRKLFYEGNISGLQSVSSGLDSCHWLILRVSSSQFVNYKFSKSTEPDKIVPNKIPELFNVSFDGSGDLTRTIESQNKIIRSATGNYISILSNVQFGTKLFPVSAIYSSDILKLNKTSGSLAYVGKPYFFNDTALYNKLDYSEHKFLSGTFSSNDSFYYYTKNIYHSKSNIDSSYIIRWNLDIQAKKTILSEQLAPTQNSQNYKRGIYDVKLGLNRKLLFLRDGKKDDTWGFHIDALDNPNAVNPRYQTQYHFFETPNAWNSNFAYSNYNYIKVKPVYKYGCDANIQFVDNCDYSLPNTKVECFLESNSGILETQGNLGSLTITKSGDYLYKVVLSSTTSNYIEEFIDTLHVRIPLKPIPNFVSSDTIVCAHHEITLKNYSYSFELHPEKGDTSYWNVSNTSGVFKTNKASDLIYKFDKPGVYSVSLRYHNGYCDSSVSKNSYIRVIEAPNSGFDTDVDKGCSPLKIQITDTISHNIKLKEYYFSNVNSWDTVALSNEQFNHTFESGKYWIIQKLTGFSGCIVQSDSLLIDVVPGLSANDSLDINIGTYLPTIRTEGNYIISDVTGWAKPQAIKLSWDSIRGAEYYNIFRDDRFLLKLKRQKSSKTLEYVDTIDFPKRHIYSVTGIDSCGTQTSSRRISVPITLSGKVAPNNMFSSLYFTNYRTSKELKAVEDYTIQVYESGIWNDLINLTDTSYVDFGFLDVTSDNTINKCYRVKSRFSSYNTYSNVVCLSYTPTIFIPNAFTPDNNGLNDNFKPITFGIKEYKMEVYNRWGELIFHSSSSDDSWDGENCNLGVYFVKVSAMGINNQRYNQVQQVHLIR